MKRKMLISIALIFIMLLNCMMPIFSVFAVSGEEIQLNSNLYTAVKKSLEQQGIVFNSDDVAHTISFSTNEELTKIVRLDLNESNISDLTGLEKFTSLEHLELSGNKLSKTSNLAVLNSLSKINYLDLSTNNIEEVNEISSLVDSLKANGTIVLSGQTVTIVNTAYVDSDENSNNAATAEFEMPKILELAGYLKSCWRTSASAPETLSDIAPSVKALNWFVNSESNKIEINIANENTGKGYYGILRYEIYIYDDQTEAASANNVNKAAENILNGSRFYLYFIVTDKNNEAITTNDTNLYNAIKNQLTGGQTENTELSSYPYTVDTNGNTIYYDCTYINAGKRDNNVANNILLLTPSNKDYTGTFLYTLDTDTNTVYTYVDNKALNYKGDFYTNDAEKVTINEVKEDDGVITYKDGYKIPYKGSEAGETLYRRAYDEAKTFIIDDTVLLNKITSLILNNKQIRDLTGLDKFVGLTSNLNVSHNYLEDIDPVYDLEKNKEEWEKILRDRYNERLKTRDVGNLQSAKDTLESDYNTLEENEKKIQEVSKKVISTLSELASYKELSDEEKKDQAKADAAAKAKQEAIDKAKKTIADEVKKVTTLEVDDNGNHIGYLAIMQDALDKISNGNDDNEKGYSDLYNMYVNLEALYNIYNKEYKLTTLLSDEINYMDIDEFEAYDNALKTSRETALSVLTGEITHIATLESANGLSNLDKSLFRKAFPSISFVDDNGNVSYSAGFSKYLEKNALNRTQIVDMVNTFREIGLYSEMANYCLIKRMNKDTADEYCYNKEYLENRMKEFSYDQLDVTLESKVLEAIKNGTSYDSLYDTYKEYEDKVNEYAKTSGETKDVYMGKGNYTKVEQLKFDKTSYTADELLAEALKLYEGEEAANVGMIREAINSINVSSVIKNILYYESIEDSYDSTKGTLPLYNQMLSLSAKLLSGNVDRYVYLPRLRVLDVSYNAALSNIERITELKQLVKLNAGYCYIDDVTNIDWTQLTKLRDLNLAYNYISDISNILDSKRLVNLDLSNNLIAGELKITNNQYVGIFKKLQSLNLSGNQITDITSLVIYLDGHTGGNYANYLAQNDTLNIDLSKQNIQMNIDTPVMLNEYPSTVDIELPKIFTQLLAIDANRTGLGETSQNGRIESEGKYVTVNTRTEGDKTAVVEVLPMNGAGQTVETCVGNGTKATIKYKVATRSVSGITVTPSENVTAQISGTVQFKAEVTGNYLKNGTVSWSIEGNTSEKTTISNDGLLTIGDDESALSIKVTATSDDDKNQKSTVDVSIPENMSKYLTVTPSENVESDVNKTVQFTANVVSEEMTDKTVTWKIEGNTSVNTVISEEGILTIAEDEKTEKVTVVCTANGDTTKVVKVDVKIASNVKEEEPDTTLVVTPNEDVAVEVEKTVQFTANVTDETLEDKSVTWSIEGNTSNDTTISENGLLTVAADEKSEKITVICTLNADNTKVVKVDVTVTTNAKEETNTSVNVTPNKDVAVEAEKTVQFTANVTDETLEDKSVTWSIEGNTSKDTTISENGLLTVAADEKSEKITVICTLNADNTKLVKVDVKVNAKSSEPSTDGTTINVGYKVEEDYLIDVKNRTSVEDFKAKLLNDTTSEYTLKFTIDQKEIKPEIIGTGMFVQILDKDGNVVKDTNGDLYVYEIIVKGDLNGDGIANSLDSVLIKALRNEVGTFTPEQKAAADINSDNNIDITDSKLLLYHRAEVSGYSLNFSK